MTALITRDELKTAIEARAVTIVDALGGDYVRKYREGIEDWTGAGLPTESA